MSKAGLRKVTKTVRGKKGTVRRSYWVRTELGHSTGHFVGSVIHEAGREGIRRLFRR